MSEAGTGTTQLPPVVKTLEVPLSRDAAFRLFTEGIDTWWPLADFSVEGEQAAEVRLEARVGGRVYELGKGGAEHLWGTVLEWDPPGRVVLSWHPGAEPSTSRKVEVTFEASSQGTRLRLSHTGWESGSTGAEHRAAYDAGWEPVLAAYGSRARERRTL